MRAKLGLRDSVEFTGWIPRGALFGNVRKAHALIYPSTFEGFGMPVLEGMAAGFPTACSSIPVLRESGGDTVLYFDPYDESSIVDALRRISNDKHIRRRLAAAGRLRAREFTGERTARMTLKVLARAAGFK